MNAEEAVKKWKTRIGELGPLIHNFWYKEQLYKFIGCKGKDCPFWRESGCIADRCILR